MVEELFRIVAVRAAEPATLVAVELADPIGGATGGETGGDDRSEALDRIERLVIAGGALVDPDAVPDQGRLNEVAEALDDDADTRVPQTVVEDAFGIPPADVVSDPAWNDTKQGLDFGLLMGKYLRPPQGPQLAALARMRLAREVVERVADNPHLSRAAAKEILGAVFLLPPSLQAPPTAKHSAAPLAGPNPQLVAELHERARALDAALDELVAVGPDDLVEVRPDSSPATAPPPQRDGLLQRVARFLGILGTDSDMPTGIADQPREAIAGPLLTAAARTRLSAGTDRLLTEAGLDPTSTSLHVITAHLRRARARNADAIRAETGGVLPRRSGVAFLGGAAIVIADARVGSAVAHPGTPPSAQPQPDEPPTPSFLSPSGVGQLLVVRQKLARYEGSEVSHIENVLKNEIKHREHTRRVLTEEVFVTEREEERSEERDLQSTDRFTLSSEIDEVVNTSKTFEGQVTISGRYGPTVKVDASTGVSLAQSKETAKKHASEYAREVVDRAVNRVQERTREQRTLRLLHEVEEINRHGFDNDVGGSDHVIGTYQWLDKVYDAQVFDYGMRTLYDIVVPEPAAFFIAAAQTEATGDPKIQAPPELSIGPADLDEGTYRDYVALYGATGVEPPPEEFVTVAQTFFNAREKDGDSARVTEGASVAIPPGYRAIQAAAAFHLMGRPSWRTAISLSVGRQKILARLEADQHNNGVTVPSSVVVSLQSGVTGDLPLAVLGIAASGFTVTVEIVCARTDRALDAWRLETYEAIRSAYELRLSEYHQAVAQAAMQAMEQARGRNPAANRKLEATELKKAAIAILANQRLLLDAVDEDAAGIPFVNIPAARENDALIRFLEQAFEWENMTYLFYPYFWGRKDPHWKQKILTEDVDPGFTDFLRAGAARIQLPVRPGFENAVDHFSKTLEPWEGGELPTITDPLYVPFVEEQKRQLGAPGNEVPFGDPWEVRVPTTLVILRADGSLPRWKKEGDAWVEVAPVADAGSTGGGGA